MTKLCARGKAAAKRKFKVYPSAYANAYASKICAGKIKDPSGVKRKDWGPKKAKNGKFMDDDGREYGPTKKSFYKKMPEMSQEEYNYKKKDKVIEATKGAEIKIKEVAKGLRKSSATNKKQAKQLDSISAYQGKFIKHDSADIKLSNQSLVNYYGDLLK